jgi:hypothetical protein
MMKSPALTPLRLIPPNTRFALPEFVAVIDSAVLVLPKMVSGNVRFGVDRFKTGAGPGGVTREALVI